MSLDKIQLHSTVLQSLYNKSLYDLNSNNPQTNTAKPAAISFLGDNLKNIAILISSTEAIYLPDEELNFLLGILTACKLSMADVALINIEKNPALSFKDVTEQFKSEKVFLFGLEPGSLGLPLEFPHYQIQHFNNQVYLSSVTLSDLQQDKAEKMKLWNCLKKIFSI
ncbi:MAG: hypothetical protein WBP16_10865 [Ferruginibacter sp.]